jgi:hypothetical protein
MSTITFNPADPAYYAKDGSPLHPGCTKCGWRMGGVDSWNGNACKCGTRSQSFPELARAWNAASAAIGRASSSSPRAG